MIRQDSCNCTKARWRIKMCCILFLFNFHVDASMSLYFILLFLPILLHWMKNFQFSVRLPFLDLPWIVSLSSSSSLTDDDWYSFSLLHFCWNNNFKRHLSEIPCLRTEQSKNWRRLTCFASFWRTMLSLFSMCAIVRVMQFRVISQFPVALKSTSFFFLFFFCFSTRFAVNFWHIFYLLYIFLFDDI